MQLTIHTDYALRLLIYLAVHRDEVKPTIQDAAKRYGISSNHLAKVAQTLVQHGYVHSHRGRGGGLQLAMGPEEINVGSLIRQTENLELLECFSEECACPIEPVCLLYRALNKAQQAFLDVLDNYTLADLVRNKTRLRQILLAS